MDNKTKIQKRINKTVKVVKNVIVNGSKEIFSSSKYDKLKMFLDEHKYVFITSIIITLFIFKNIYTIVSYNAEIKEAEKMITEQTAINNQLKEDIKYYKTDEFILRYALEELNLRPTRALELYHGEVPVSEEDLNKATNEKEETSQEQEVVNNNEESTEVQENTSTEEQTQEQENTNTEEENTKVEEQEETLQP